jgi:hypothetical protein
MALLVGLPESALADEQEFPCRRHSTMVLHGGWTVAAVQRRCLAPSTRWIIKNVRKDYTENWCSVFQLKNAIGRTHVCLWFFFSLCWNCCTTEHGWQFWCNLRLFCLSFSYPGNLECFNTETVAIERRRPQKRERWSIFKIFVRERHFWFLIADLPSR